MNLQRRRRREEDRFWTLQVRDAHLVNLGVESHLAMNDVDVVLRHSEGVRHVAQFDSLVGLQQLGVGLDLDLPHVVRSG